MIHFSLTLIGDGPEHKALKKLALDAIVIQQGRLQEAQKTVGKDDLMSMVRFGAEKVFQSKDSTITDEDVDAIIAKGEANTAELTEKMKARTLNPKTWGPSNLKPNPKT